MHREMNIIIIISSVIRHFECHFFYVLIYFYCETFSTLIFGNRVEGRYFDIKKPEKKLWNWSVHIICRVQNARNFQILIPHYSISFPFYSS